MIQNNKYGYKIMYKEKGKKVENSNVLNSLEQTESFKVDELSIWKKAEEKLSNALK